MKRDDKKSARPTVYLVGAGPGDPGLITMKGANLLSRADVLIYDRLVDKKILSYAKPGATLLYVGKEGGSHTLTQDEINSAMVREARAGKTVVRLKGGDPYIFGRGGEEALFLVKNGIPFEVVPGVSSASAVPAYAGIPVTHRGIASAVAFITGHEDPTKGDESVDWEELSRFPGTLVILMGVQRIGENIARLIAAGKSPETPAAAISWGTTPRQRGVFGTLKNIADLVAGEKIAAPAVFVVGEVVKLRRDIGCWFEGLPLFGKTVIVTRAREQAGELTDKLRDLGAYPIEVPAIEISPPADEKTAERAIKEIKNYDIIVFTSPNGVTSFFRTLNTIGGDSRALGGRIVAAMGPGTASVLLQFGIRADIIPEKYIAEELSREIIGSVKGGIRGKKILLFRAEEARKALVDILVGAGGVAHEVSAYRSLLPRADENTLKGALDSADLVTFTSGSTAKNFARLIIESGIKKSPTDVPAAVIGPITAEEARGAGFRVVIESEEHTIDGLLDAIEFGFHQCSKLDGEDIREFVD